MSRRHRILMSLALVALTAMVYWQVRSFDFINYDDPGYITSNDRVQRGLTLQNIGWAFVTLEYANWHPVTWLSHMLDCTLFGSDKVGAGWHHLENVAWHAINAVVLFLLLASMTGAAWRSWIVAALFAVHPLHVESVAWIAERKDLLSSFFGLLAVGAYVRWVRTQHGTWFTASLGLFALSLMSKPMLVTLPCLLLLLDYWPLKRLSSAGQLPVRPKAKAVKIARQPRLVTWRWLLLEKTPYFALSIASSIITVIAQSRGGAMENMQVIGLDVRLGNAIISYGRYMSQAIWPARMSVLYPYPLSSQGESIEPVALFSSFALLVVITFAAIVTARRWPHVIVGWLWFLGTLVPVIGLVQVGEQSRADRYTYLPLTGLFIILVWMIPAAVSSRSPRSWRPLAIRIGVTAAALITLAAVAYQQAGVWRDSVTLYTHALAVTNSNPIIEHNLGVAYMENNDPQRAVQRFRAALRLRPNYVNATRNLGRVLITLGQVDEGVMHLQMAETAEPDFAETVSDLGVGYKQQGKVEQAIRQFERAVSLDPNLMLPYLNLGSLYFEQHQYDKAIRHLQTAAELQPDQPQVQYYLGASLAGTGRFADAVPHLQRAVASAPSWLEARVNLAHALLGANRPDQAIQHYRKALELTQDQQVSLLLRNNMARAMSQAGQVEQAVAECQALIDASPNDPILHLNFAMLLLTTKEAKHRDPARAVRLAERAVTLTNRQDAGMLSALARAQAAAGAFDAAVQSARSALELARRAGNNELAMDLERRLSLYSSNRAE